MWQPPNYIPDLNRFALAGPPAFWLKQLWSFDSSLVVIPSRQQCIYRLAQRRVLNLPEKIVNEASFKESDTRMLASYSLIPVTSIIPTANWGNPYLFVELHNRAPWRLGGAKKVNQELEEREELAAMDKRTHTDEHLTYLGKDAWKLYLKKIGLRSHMWSPTTRPIPSIHGKAPALVIH